VKPTKNCYTLSKKWIDKEALSILIIKKILKAVKREVNINFGAENLS